MEIFVANLNFDTKESDLKEAFEAFGTVESIKIDTKNNTGLVNMPKDSEGKDAIDLLNGFEFDGAVIEVKAANS